MLPVLFKLSFDTPFMQVVLVLLALALTGYGAFSGWRGAGEDASRRLRTLRAVSFGAFSAIAACVGAVWGAPRFSPAMTTLVKGLVYAFSAVMVVAAYLYGQQDAKEAKKSSGEDAFIYAAMAAAAAFVAVRFGLQEPFGKNLGAPLHNYGLMIATAFIVAIGVAAREANRAFPGYYVVDGQVQKDEDGKPVLLGKVMREHIMDLGFYVLIAALAGSRILFVIVNWDDYKQDLTQVLSVAGGFVFYGGFIGAVAVSIWYCRKYKLDFLRIADVSIPSVALGHMFGRLGCLSAGCCWGGIAREGSKIAIRFPSAKNLPFGGFNTDSLAYQSQLHDKRWADAAGHLYDHAVAGAQQLSAYAHATGFSMPVYPTQLMESTGELLMFLLLINLRRVKRFNGQILSVYLMGYAVLRTTVEFFRGDVERGYLFKWPSVDPVLLSTSQTISIGIFLLGVAVWVVNSRRASSPAALQAAV